MLENMHSSPETESHALADTAQIEDVDTAVSIEQDRTAASLFDEMEFDAGFLNQNESDALMLFFNDVLIEEAGENFTHTSTEKIATIWNDENQLENPTSSNNIEENPLPSNQPHPAQSGQNSGTIPVQEGRVLKTVPSACSQCFATFRGGRDMARHIKNAHTGELNHQCKLCIARFRTRRQLSIHSSTFHRNMFRRNMAECPQCKKLISGGGGGLKRHLEVNHTGDLNFVCQKCPARFRTKAQIAHHNATMHPKIQECATEDSLGDSAIIVSSGAPRSSAQHAEDAIHEDAIDKLMGPEFNINESEGTQARAVSTAGANEGQVSLGQECTNCKMSFSRPWALRRHMATSHSGPQTELCTQCTGTFSNKRQLSIHVAERHPGMEAARTFVCPMCGASLLHKFLLRNHIDGWHTGELPYSCNMCIARFKKSRQLLAHMKAMHQQ